MALKNLPKICPSCGKRLSVQAMKEMAQKLGLSYPTVRNRLDDIIAQLNQFEGDEQDS